MIHNKEREKLRDKLREKLRDKLREKLGERGIARRSKSNKEKILSDTLKKFGVDKEKAES